MSVSREDLAEVLLRAMILASLADGERVRAEDEVVLLEHQRIAGRRLPISELEARFAAVQRDPEASWAWVAARVPDLADEQRQEVVRAVVRVGIADAELMDGELTAFTRFARVLAIPPADLRRLMNQVWRESLGES